MSVKFEKKLDEIIMEQTSGIHMLPELPYTYDALEPYIDTETMELHHKKHHQSYVNKLNKAMDRAPDNIKAMDIDTLMLKRRTVPIELKRDVFFYGGGHYNHSLFWKCMSPDPKSPEGDLSRAINRTFGSYESFKREFTISAMQHLGDGWTWLTVGKHSKKLSITSMSEHNCPMTISNKPMFVLDLFEHTYYLKYRNEKDKFIENWWDVADWREAEEIFSSIN